MKADLQLVRQILESRLKEADCSRGLGDSILTQQFADPIDMTQEAAELLKKALALPAEERANLASTLIDSLDATIDEHAEAAWQEEVRRRIDDLRSGRVRTVPWEEVQEKARTLLDDQNRR